MMEMEMELELGRVGHHWHHDQEGNRFPVQGPLE